MRMTLHISSSIIWKLCAQPFRLYVRALLLFMFHRSFINAKLIHWETCVCWTSVLAAVAVPSRAESSHAAGEYTETRSFAAEIYLMKRAWRGYAVQFCSAPPRTFICFIWRAQQSLSRSITCAIISRYYTCVFFSPIVQGSGMINLTYWDDITARLSQHSQIQSVSVWNSVNFYWISDFHWFKFRLIDFWEESKSKLTQPIFTNFSSFKRI